MHTVHLAESVFAGQKLTPPAGLNLTPLSYKMVDLDNKDCSSFAICSGGTLIK